MYSIRHGESVWSYETAVDQAAGAEDVDQAWLRMFGQALDLKHGYVQRYEKDDLTQWLMLNGHVVARYAEGWSIYEPEPKRRR